MLGYVLAALNQSRVFVRTNAHTTKMLTAKPKTAPARFPAVKFKIINREGQSAVPFPGRAVATFFMDDDRLILDWRDVHHESGRWADRWGYTLALYGILHPRRDEILYLGKADGCTVRSRWNADDNHELVWRRIEQERGLFEHGFLVGEFRLPDGQRLTRELVCDVESLLIHQIKPWANTRNSRSRGLYLGLAW